MEGLLDLPRGPVKFLSGAKDEKLRPAQAVTVRDARPDAERRIMPRVTVPARSPSECLRKFTDLRHRSMSSARVWFEPDHTFSIGRPDSSRTATSEYDLRFADAHR
jgi:hypothetical protein